MPFVLSPSCFESSKTSLMFEIFKLDQEYNEIAFKRTHLKIFFNHPIDSHIQGFGESLDGGSNGRQTIHSGRNSASFHGRVFGPSNRLFLLDGASWPRSSLLLSASVAVTAFARL